ncbi:hypothetical protein [Brevibacillus brevis]|uniref:hypothetical protein n=1 Tax=Brevibacillus brevis TaxID=1393 RepID=UPI00165E571F|nr:hypothetical protein [Brevibacillus brevis]
MKLKFPAIYSYAEMGSRGAWTGNALLLRSFGNKASCKYFHQVKIISDSLKTSYNEVNSRFKEKGEISEALWDTSRGAVEKGKHAFKRPPLNMLHGEDYFGRGFPFSTETCRDAPMQGAQEARAFSPFSAATNSNDIEFVLSPTN